MGGMTPLPTGWSDPFNDNFDDGGGEYAREDAKTTAVHGHGVHNDRTQEAGGEGTQAAADEGRQGVPPQACGQAVRS